MKDSIKNALGYAAIAALVAVSLSALGYVKSYADNSFAALYSASGTGKVVVIPDIARLQVGVVTEGGLDLGKLQSENSDKANGIIDFLKAQGVDEKDIKTQSYGISPRYQYANCGYDGERTCPPPTIVGYSVNQSLEVNARNFEKIGDILSGVVDRGANSVYGPSFTVDDPAVPEQEAREQAIAKAKAKAMETAKAAGIRLGKIISISEGGYGGPGPVYYGQGMGGGGESYDGAKAPSLEPGSQEVQVQVTVTFEIE